MYYLIIRPGAIGDNLLTFPILQRLRAQAPPTHITFIGNSSVLPLAQVCGVADEAYDYQDARWARLFMPGSVQDRIIQRSERAICWLNDPEGIIEHNLRAAGIKQIIVAPGRPSPGEAIHIVEYLARTVGVSWHLRDDGPQMLLRLPGIEENVSADGARRPVAIHPGSGGAHKCWPVEYFVDVIHALWGRGLPVLLLAGPAERERLARLRMLLSEPPYPELLRWLIDAPLLDVAQHLLTCRAYLGNDSGLTHLAALLGTPTVALFGPSDSRMWRPVGRVVSVLHKPQLVQIGVEQVLSTLDRIMVESCI